MSSSDIWVCEFEGNTEPDRQTPLFGRGRLDHLALQSASLEAFEEIRSRLMARGAGYDFVTDFGFMLSIFFRHVGGSILLSRIVGGTIRVWRKEYRGTQSDR